GRRQWAAQYYQEIAFFRYAEDAELMTAAWPEIDGISVHALKWGVITQMIELLEFIGEDALTEMSGGQHDIPMLFAMLDLTTDRDVIDMMKGDGDE
ncbi:MAG: hypothetical protein JSV16_09060, partial [Candidatus Hydrogenedentota bacterium]